MIKRLAMILSAALVAVGLVGQAWAKPSLKSVTAKHLFKETAAISGRPDYLGCSRVTRMRFSCRAKWSYTWEANSTGNPVTDIWKVRGFVKRNGYWIKVKARTAHTVVDSTGTHKDSATVWKLYRFR